MWQSYSTDTDRDSQLVKWKELNIYTLRKLWNIQSSRRSTQLLAAMAEELQWGTGSL